MIKYGEQKRKFDTRRTQYKALTLLTGIKEGKVLDCGAGLGEAATLMQKQGLEVVCIDGNEQFSEHAKGLGFDAYTVNLEEQRFPFDAQSFDGVISLETIEHISNIANFFNEITRVLKPGGWFLISTPNNDYWVVKLKKIFGFASPLEDPRHHRIFSSKSLKNELENRGFDVIDHIAILNIPKTKLSFVTKLFPDLLAMQIAYKCVNQSR